MTCIQSWSNNFPKLIQKYNILNSAKRNPIIRLKQYYFWKVIWPVWVSSMVKIRFETMFGQLSASPVDLEGSWGPETGLRHQKFQKNIQTKYLFNLMIGLIAIDLTSLSQPHLNLTQGWSQQWSQVNTKASQNWSNNYLERTQRVLNIRRPF